MIKKKNSKYSSNTNDYDIVHKLCEYEENGLKYLRYCYYRKFSHNPDDDFISRYSH